MILRDPNERPSRKSKRKRDPSFQFEKLEDRKMMAADGLAPLSPMTHDTMVMGSHDPAANSRHSAMMEQSCNHHSMPAVMALVSDEAATHVATRSGNWSDSSTWQNGVVPGAGARIVIPAGQSVTVDQVFQDSFKTIRIDGTLSFATNVDTQLKVDTLVSTGCGRLEMGTQANPVQANVTAKVLFADDGAIDLNWDPTQISRGAILMGTTELHGAETTDRVTLASQPVAGAAQLQLNAIPTNWNPGDQIVITGTQGATSDEVRTIASIAGRTLVLNQPLELDHVTPKNHLDVHVVNKTRNVEFRSENTAIARRGHIMFGHTHHVDIDHTGFYELGRTDKSRELDDVYFEFPEELPGNRSSAPVHFTTSEGERTNIRGRYAVHFHRGGVDPNSTPATVHGSVVDGSPGWGFVNHSSHVNFTNNIAYGVWGSAYYTEAGDEIGTFDGNIAIRSVNPRDPVDPVSKEIATDLGHENQEFGNSGDGFWLSGHLVSMKNNISSGNSGHGFIIWSDGLVEHDLGENSGRTTVKTADIANGHLITGRSEIPVWWAPLAEVSNNEASGAVIGFRTRYIHSNSYLGEGGSPFHASPDQAYIDTLTPTIDGLKVWGSREGVLLNYSERLSLKNAEIIGIGEPFVDQEGTTDVGVGLDLANVISRGSGRLENVKIEGFSMGIMAPRNDQWVMDNVSLSNTTDMLIKEPRLGPRTMTMSNFTFGSLDGTAVAGTANQRRNLAFGSVDFTDGSAQPYFFLLADRITLDGQGLYSNNQAGNFVPLTEVPDGNPIEEVPEEYVGLTNQQLKNQYGLSFGGAIIPDNHQRKGWLTGGVVGPAAPAATQFPVLYDMTAGGEFREPPKGGPVPELTGNRLHIRNGETVTLMITNLNTTDTNSGLADLRYTVSQVQHGYFAHRDTPSTPISSFTQAEINGGVIRFVHDGSGNAPAYRARVTDGTSTTNWSQATIFFDGDDQEDSQTKEIGYSSTVRVNHRWKQVDLPRSFTDPVIVAGGASRNGGHQGVVRIRNVTNNSFEIRFQEWDYLDRRHAFEDIGFLVVEAGTHELTDGTKLVAGKIGLVHERLSSVDFDSPFQETPVVISQIMTNNGGAAVTDRIRNLNDSGFQIQMNEEEAADHSHNWETLGWIAIDQGTATSGERSLNSMLAQNVTHRTSVVKFGNVDSDNPIVLTDMQTRNGGDVATVRHRSQSSTTVSLFLEEEQSANAETAHTRETVGVLALEPGILVAKDDQTGGMIRSNKMANSSFVNFARALDSANGQSIDSSFRGHPLTHLALDSEPSSSGNVEEQILALQLANLNPDQVEQVGRSLDLGKDADPVGNHATDRAFTELGSMELDWI